MVAGYIGGLPDAVVMRLTDMMLIFPTIMIAIIIVVVVGPSEHGVVIALGLSQLPNFIRIARSAAFRAWRTLCGSCGGAGASWPDILMRHVLHNISGPIIVKSTLALPGFVLGASSLSYLGLGVQPPTPEWGQMLHRGEGFSDECAFTLSSDRPLHSPFFVLSANMAGDSLNESLDPSSRAPSKRVIPRFVPRLVPRLWRQTA